MTETVQLPRINQTPAGVVLGPLEDVADGRARGYVLEIGQARFHGFVVRTGDAVVGYVDHCPHWGLPLTRKLDAYLTDDGRYVDCTWHGALFRPSDGYCVSGPCVGDSLMPWPVQVKEGRIVTA